MAEFKVVMPIKPYLKKFMASYAKVDPIYNPSRKEVFGSYLYMLLNDKYSFPGERVSEMKDKIVIVVPEMWLSRARYDLQNKEVVMFNNFAENFFYQQFYMYMDMAITMGSRMDIARASFCELYDIDLDTDINDETLKKRYDRFCLNRSSFPNPFKLSNGKPRPRFQLNGTAV